MHKGIPVPPPNLNARFLEVKDIIAYRGMDQDIDLTPELKHLLSKCTWSSTVPGSVIEYYVWKKQFLGPRAYCSQSKI